MKKRKRVVRAGNLVWATICTPPAPNDPEHVRAAKSRATTAARKALNLKAACRRLEMLLAANFTPRDFHLILTYRPDDLPATRKEAVKRLRKFLAQLRAYRKARGLPLKYVYATEGLHGDKRFHHHLVINATAGDYDLIRSLWIWGDQVDLERIADRDYGGLARYLTKEAAEGKPNGAQSWTPSRGLTKAHGRNKLGGRRRNLDRARWLLCDRAGGQAKRVRGLFLYSLPHRTPTAAQDAPTSQ